MAEGQAGRDAPRRPRRPWVLLRPAMSAAALLVVYAVLPLDGGSVGTLTVLALGLAALVAMLGWQVRAVLRSPTPRLRAVEALATAIPFFLVLFASGYVGLSRMQPTAFTEPLDRTAALYFTVTVFATVGFGDIAPVAQPARIAVTVQMVSGLLLLGGGVRILLGAAQQGRRRIDAGEPGRPEIRPARSP